MYRKFGASLGYLELLERGEREMEGVGRERDPPPNRKVKGGPWPSMWRKSSTWLSVYGGGWVSISINEL